MSKQSLLESIRVYPSKYSIELDYKARFINLILKYDNCLDRSLLIGHITGSAWIIDTNYNQVLLTHHRKLDKWLQLGGHADGDSNILRLAQREAIEESGIKSIIPIHSDIFDIDIHTIPGRSNEPQHKHYDIRYAFIADMEQELVINHESKALKWVPIGMVGKLVNNSESIMRMVEKTSKLKIVSSKNI